jgi:hypothetical protein
VAQELYEAESRWCGSSCGSHLVSYGDTQFPANKVHQLAGFSEKVFDTMALLETDRLAGLP